MIFAVKFVEISILTAVKVLRVIMLILHRLRFHQGKGIDADVGTLVGNTFDIHQNIQEGNAAVNRAVAAVESVEVFDGSWETRSSMTSSIGSIFFAETTSSFVKAL